MSTTMNTLSLLTAGLLGGKARVSAPEGSLFLSDAASDPAAPSADDAGNDGASAEVAAPGDMQFLSAVGRETEEVRRRQETIIRKANWLGSLEDDLAEVFAHTSQLLADLEQTKSELAKREAVGKLEREARDGAVQQNKELNEHFERTQSELDLLRPEMSRLANAVDEAESRIQHLESDGAHLREQLAELNRGLVKQRELTRFAEQELDAARSELKSSDLLLAQRVTEVAEIGQRAEIADQNIRSLNVALAESQGALAHALTDLEDARIGLDTSRNRIVNLESELQDFQQGHTHMRSLWQREADQHNTDVAALRTQLDQATGVAGVHERLLTDVRLELQARSDDLKQTERRALDAELAVEQGAERLLAAEASLGKALADQTKARSQQKTLVRRVKPLIGALREKQNESRQMTLRVEDMESRIEAKGREMIALTEQLEGRLTALTEELEAERSRRVLAEGALGVDRDKRAAEQAADDVALVKASAMRAVDGELSANANGRLLLGRPRAAGDAAKLKRARRPGEAA
jgi:hypothetical protein